MISCYCNITYNCNNRCLFCAANTIYPEHHQEISLDKFREILDFCNVQNNDIVVLNGGEPTLHNDFLSFCKEVSHRGAIIDIFTNGKKLAEKEFVASLLSIPTPIVIRIPFFGHSNEVHDYLTGVKGNFEAVLTSIHNIKSYANKNITIDIKLLLSKATLPENPLIFDLLLPILKDRRFQLSINRLLISKQVVLHKDLFFLPYRDLIDGSLELLEKIQHSEIRYRINMPLCLFAFELPST